VEIDNPSKKKLEAIKFVFYQKIVLTANGETLTKRQEVFSGTIELNQLQTHYTKEALIDIPNNTPPSITSSLVTFICDDVFNCW
jgi:hypothetical protein